VVFAPPRASFLRGARPALAHSDVRWIATTARDDSLRTSWIDPLAVMSFGRGLRVTIGTSDATSTRFSVLKVTDASRATMISDPMSHAEVEIRKVADDFAVRLSGTKPENWLPVLIHRPIRVAIVHGPQRAEDARYVAAAVRAVGEISDRQIMVEVREENESTVLPESDWVFRLGASPLTPSMSHVLAEGRVNVVTDAAREAAEGARPSWFVASDDRIGINETRSWRRAQAGAEPGVIIWSDGFGNPLLTFAREGRAERWRFLSRFHPESNDWVGSGAFPAWMRERLLGNPDDLGARLNDRRLADPEQIQPDHAADGESPPTLPPASGRNTDLHIWLWALAALLLALERGVSLRPTAPRGSGLIPVPADEPQTAEVTR